MITKHLRHKVEEIKEYEAMEIVSDYENGYGKLSDKEFVESRHYFKLLRGVKSFIGKNLHLADGDDCTLKELKDLIS